MLYAIFTAVLLAQTAEATAVSPQTPSHRLMPSAAVGELYSVETTTGTVTGVFISDDGNKVRIRNESTGIEIPISGGEFISFAPAHASDVSSDLGSVDISSEFDKFDNITALSVRFTEMQGCPLHISSIVISSGNTERNPRSAMVGFYYSGDDWEYLKTSRRVVFLLDGRRAEHDIDHDGEVHDGWVSEAMWSFMTHNEMSAIANAKNAEFQIGNTECTISGLAKKALRALATRTKPLHKKPAKKREGAK